VITCLVVYVANIPTGGRGMDWDGVLVYGGRGGGLQYGSSRGDWDV